MLVFPGVNYGPVGGRRRPSAQAEITPAAVTKSPRESQTSRFEDAPGLPMGSASMGLATTSSGTSAVTAPIAPEISNLNTQTPGSE